MGIAGRRRSREEISNQLYRGLRIFFHDPVATIGNDSRNDVSCNEPEIIGDPMPAPRRGP
jgi:hypothetical protein